MSDALIQPTDIDLDHTPRQRESVVGAELDGELVLYDEDDGSIHVLNPSAATVWACLDGSVTIDELAAELSEAFEADAAVIRDDVLGLVRQLGHEGLLAGVEGDPKPEQYRT